MSSTASSNTIRRSNKIVPDLAQSPGRSTDGGKVMTFKLRERRERSTRDTAHARRRTSSSRSTACSIPKRPANTAASLPASSRSRHPMPTTVRLVFEKPNAGFLHKVTAFNQGWIVSKKAITEIGDKAKLDSNRHWPVRLREMDARAARFSFPRTRIISKARRSSIRLVLRLIKDETAAAIALEKGEDRYLLLAAAAADHRSSEGQDERHGCQPRGQPHHQSRAQHDDQAARRRACPPGDGLRHEPQGIWSMAISRGPRHPAISCSRPRSPNTPTTSPNTPMIQRRRKPSRRRQASAASISRLRSVGLSPYDKLVVPLANDLQQIGINTKIRVLERGAYGQARNSGNVMSCITGVVGPPDPDSPLVTLYATKSFPPGMNTARYDQVR